VLEHFLQSLQFLAIYASLLKDIQHELFVRVPEEPTHEVFYLGAAGILAFDERRIHMGAAVFGMPYITFLLKDADDSKDRVISQDGLPWQGFQHLLDGAIPALPKDFHDAKFRFGQNCRSAPGHSSLLFLLDASFSKK
jgi:hypothetical protein